MPTLEEYQEQAGRNLLLMSRTAKGILDLGASADKGAKIVPGLDAEGAAELARLNLEMAVEYAFEGRHEIGFVTCPQSLRFVIETLAQKVNRGILRDGCLFRGGADSDKYLYTRVADLERAMQRFYYNLHQQIRSGADAITLAALAEWHIDMRDHFFADGCGKAAKMASAWLLMRANTALPDYTMGGGLPANLARVEYLSHRPRQIPGEHPAQDELDYRHFLDYYRSLF